jgi:hypothetical protein
VPPALHGDQAHPGQAQGWVESRLYFGLGPADHPEKRIDDAQWRDFLNKEVTPRFPAGLSVLDVYGRWQDKKQSSPERLRLKLLIIDHSDTQEDSGRIEAVRASWKQCTGDQSALAVTEPADVSF